jgi:hypothetical protein
MSMGARGLRTFIDVLDDRPLRRGERFVVSVALPR